MNEADICRKYVIPKLNSVTCADDQILDQNSLTVPFSSQAVDLMEDYRSAQTTSSDTSAILPFH